MRASDVLRRFRPVGAPGAAAARGVPADRVAEVSAELEPVFALLAPAVEACDAIRAEADRTAAAKRTRAVAQAEAVRAAAAGSAAAVRADTVVRLTRDADAGDEQLVQAARAESEVVLRDAADRLPALLARTRAELAARLGSTAAPP